jgi:hypothetical protein
LIAVAVILSLGNLYFNFREPPSAPAFEEIRLVDNGRGEPRGQRLLAAGVYFAPLGGFPVDTLRRLSRQIEHAWGIPSALLGEITVEKSARPKGNSQLDAFDLVDQVRRAYVLEAKPGVVIGFVGQDIRAYGTGDFWNYGAVHPDGYAVISTARMNPLSFGEPADPTLLMYRLRKMATRYIAVIHFKLHYSGNPRSVVYEAIRSQHDLDRMTEWPCPDRPTEMIAC